MSPTILFDDAMMMEILSWLPVKSLLQFKCVSKWFQSLISSPYFVKLHFQRSSKTANILLSYRHKTLNRSFLFPWPVQSLVENHSLGVDLSYGFDLNVDNKNEYWVNGTCNGLVYLFSHSYDEKSCIFCVWNPATRKIFQYPQFTFGLPQGKGYLIRKTGLGYDNLTDTYKLVVIFANHDGVKSCYNVGIRNISDNGDWKNIENFPADLGKGMNYTRGLYLNNTLNWIAVANDHKDGSEIRFGNLVIVSLDCGDETFTKFLLPSNLDAVDTIDFHPDELNFLPKIGVLKDCFSLFLRNHKTDHFCIWQMKEFKNQESWTQLFNISIRDARVKLDVKPYGIFEDGCVFMVYGFLEDSYDLDRPTQFRAMIYDGRDNTVKQIKISDGNILWIHVDRYVQSLASPTRY